MESLSYERVLEVHRFNKLKLKSITLETNSDVQKRTKERLLQILTKYPAIERYTFTDQVVIKDEGISFSHPVLTLGAKNLESKNDDFEFLSIYIHETLHWFVLQHEDNFRKAMKEIRDIYPKVKISNNDGGARSEESTYVHIVVCYLEYVVLKEILGKRVVEQVVKSHSFYQ